MDPPGTYGGPPPPSPWNLPPPQPASWSPPPPPGPQPRGLGIRIAIALSLVVIGAVVIGGKTLLDRLPHLPGSVCQTVALQGASSSLPDTPARDDAPDDLRRLLPETLPGTGALLDSHQAASAREDSASRYDPVGWQAAEEDNGFDASFTRSWALSGEDGVVAEVQRFDSPEHALAFRAWADQFSCRYSDLAFAVPGVPGATGLQIRYRSGMVQQRVSFVRGSRRYAVSTMTKGPPAGTSRVAAIAAAVAEQAR